LKKEMSRRMSGLKTSKHQIKYSALLKSLNSMKERTVMSDLTEGNNPEVFLAQVRMTRNVKFVYTRL
jgi:hypothetical protein